MARRRTSKRRTSRRPRRNPAGPGFAGWNKSGGVYKHGAWTWDPSNGQLTHGNEWIADNVDISSANQRIGYEEGRAAPKKKGFFSWNPRRSKRTSRRNPPPLYRAIGIDSRGQRVSLGAGPLSRIREATFATWAGDPSLRSAYVIDQRGHSYLSLEPKDRQRLMANRHAQQLDGLEHEVEHELEIAWSALRGGDAWRAQDAFAHVEALQDFATGAQRTEIRSLRAALKDAGVEPWHEDVRRNRKHAKKRRPTRRRASRR